MKPHLARAAAYAATLLLLSVLAAACGPGAAPNGGSVPSRSDHHDR
jgi:hypothetical protein